MCHRNPASAWSWIGTRLMTRAWNTKSPRRNNFKMPRAFQIQAEDNVATLMDDAPAGVVEILGAGKSTVLAVEKIARGHKIALREIAANEAVIKIGVRIGHATQA